MFLLFLLKELIGLKIKRRILQGDEIYKMRIIINFLVFTLFIGCKDIDEKTSSEFSLKKRLFDSADILTHKSSGKTYTCRSNNPIDIKTLKDLGEFLIDKNRVYSFYDISDGILILELDDADRTSFRTYGTSIYGRDKNYVYSSRNGRMESADVKSFEVVNINGIEYGKDKNNYFFWDKIVLDTTGFSELIK